MLRSPDLRGCSSALTCFLCARILSQPRLPNPARLLSSSQLEVLASKDGSRRTVYYTKQLPEGDGYARTHQYLGEWKDNLWHGKGTLEKADGTRYVGEWAGGKRHGIGTLWHRHKDGSLRKVYSGNWENDTMGGGSGAFLATRLCPGAQSPHQASSPFRS